MQSDPYAALGDPIDVTPAPASAPMPANNGSTRRAPVPGRKYSVEDAIQELGMTAPEAQQFVTTGKDPRADVAGPATPAEVQQPDPYAQVATDAEAPASAQTADQSAPPAISTNEEHVTAPDRVILQDADALPQGQDTGVVGEKGGSHTITDPRFKGANQTVQAMIRGGVSSPHILTYLKGLGYSDSALLNMAHQLGEIRSWQKRNPGYKGSFVIDIERDHAPNSVLQNFMGSDVGAGVTAAGDAGTAFALPKIAAAVGADGQQVQDAIAAAEQAHPKSAAAGTLAGGVGTSLAAETALLKAGVPEIAAPLVADALYGGTAGGVTTDIGADGQPATAMDRVKGAVKGAVASVAGNVGGQLVGKGLKAAGSPAGDAYVATINDANIPTTVGQQYSGKIGGIIKRTEDRIAGLPILGEIINARRAEGIRTFNVRSFDHALKPIGENVGNAVGEEAIDEAQDKISQAFGRALNGKTVNADTPFVKDLTNAVTDLSSLPRVGTEVADSVKEILAPYMTGNALTGEGMQQMSRELRDLKASYFRSNEPMAKRIGNAIDGVENAIFGPFRRQAPEVLPAYNRAKSAQRRLYILADAVNKAKNKEGIFMPHQLGQADRAATVKTEGKVNAARGRGQFHELQRAAQQVLPSSIPDSGTAGRLVIPAAVLGVGAASDESGLTHGAGLTLAGALALAYSRAGQRILTKPGRGIGGTVGKVLTSDKTRRALSRAGAVTGAVAATQR